MNEIYRVLKPGGIFLHVTPAFPSPEAFQDPTHVNIITENTFPCYFCNPNPDAKNLGYGFTGDFELIDQRWLHNTWIVGLLRDDEHPSHAGFDKIVEYIEYLKPKKTIFTHMTALLDEKLLKLKCPDNVYPGYDGMEISL